MGRRVLDDLPGQRDHAHLVERADLGPGDRRASDEPRTRATSPRRREEVRHADQGRNARARLGRLGDADHGRARRRSPASAGRPRRSPRRPAPAFTATSSTAPREAAGVQAEQSRAANGLDMSTPVASTRRIPASVRTHGLTVAELQGRPTSPEDLSIVASERRRSCRAVGAERVVRVGALVRRVDVGEGGHLGLGRPDAPVETLDRAHALGRLGDVGRDHGDDREGHHDQHQHAACLRPPCLTPGEPQRQPPARDEVIVPAPAGRRAGRCRTRRRSRRRAGTPRGRPTRRAAPHG